MPRHRRSKASRPTEQPQPVAPNDLQQHRNSFDDLFQQHERELREKLLDELKLCRDDDRDEVVQDACTAAYDAWCKTKVAPDDFLDWLLGFAKPAANKLLKNRRHTASSQNVAELAEAEEENPDSEPGVEQQAAMHSKQGDLLRESINLFIKSLEESVDRETLSAYLWQPENSRGYAPAIAKKFDLKAGTIRNKKKKLVDKLQEYLLKKGYSFPEAKITPETIKRLIASISGNSVLAKSPAKGGLTNQQASGIATWADDKTRPDEHVTSPAVGLEPPRYVSTGFKPLDVLLGGAGFIQGSSILVRGQPGTGKTTLALQIAKHAISKGHDFVYASVEDQPEVLLDRVTQSFWDQNHKDYLGPDKWWKVVDLTRYFDCDVKQQARNETLKRLLETARLSEAEQEAHKELEKLADAFMDHPLAERNVRLAMQETMHEMELDVLLKQLWEKLLVEDTEPVILVVDSLNALINGATMRFHFGSSRQIMLTVLNSFRRWRSARRGQVTVIFLVERDARIENAAASYLADVVIDLGWRAVEQLVYETKEMPSKWLQGIRFCRIRKGRGLPIQDRSCAYEFVKDSDESLHNGITFLPTYAARGVVSLFHENPAMQEVITTLRMHDVPALFPQVIVQEFSRTALQRMFSVSRRRTSISLRHPMMLSNIDEYWLKRLRYNKLIHSIPESRLRIYSLSPDDSTESVGKSSFIKELDGKEEMFAETNENGEKEYYGVPEIANVGMLVYRRDLLRKIEAEPPDTWEEVEEICKKLRDKKEPTYKLRLELTSYDTFLATALELGWAHGAFWRTSDAPDNKLKIEFEPGSGVIHLIAALIRLRHWIFSMKIVPKGSSVDPDTNPDQDWVFARHWYSTWINVSMRNQVAESRRNGAEYGVLPIPLDSGHKERSNGTARHHSAWGEWYLAILRGSENIELGIELINNLMTARKITERARSGAALPTAERFYEITDEDCPEAGLSFNEVREQFFADAKSRSEFDDYPRFARIFSAVLHTVTTNPRADVIETVRKGLLNIDPDFNWPTDVKQQLNKILSSE